MQNIKTISLFLCLAVISASCGNPSQAQNDISTAVAQTVQAQNSLTEVAALPTLTSVPPLQPTATPEADSTNTPAAGPASNPGCIASAVLVGENPPDKTLLTPGEYFWKTWTFRNTGSCFWDTSYSLVFWDGELMGGLTSYPLSEVVAPEGTFDISIYLQAPLTDGTSTGYWRLQTPWGENFGVGPQSSSFYVQISVSSSTKLKYEVTNVTYELVRDPEVGCPLNVRYTVYATVTTNGPAEFDYRWDQSDGNESGIRYYEVKEAGTTVFKREWMVSLNDNAVPRWINFLIIGPKYKDFGPIIWEHDCLKK